MRSIVPAFLVALSVLLSAGCGGGASTSASGASTAGNAGREPRRSELAKLDDALRDRIGHDDRFPIRVKFVHRPSRSELETLLLVPLERDAVGTVDREMLETIIARDDVAHVTRVDAGYEED